MAPPEVEFEDSSEAQLARLERGDRSLWILTATLIVNLAIVVLALYYAAHSVSEAPPLSLATSERDLAVSLGGLVLVFVLFLFWKQARVGDLRRHYMRERLRSEALRARLVELTSLFDAAVRIRAPMDLEPALDTIAERVLNSLSCDGSAILLKRPGAMAMTFAALAGSASGRRPLELLERNEVALAGLAEEAEPTAWGREEFARIAGLPDTDELSFGALLSVPLPAAHRTLGALLLLRCDGRPPFTLDERVYFADFGRQLAAVIDRIEQFAVLQRENRLLETTNRRLVDLNRLKRLVLSTVNHEVRTPLSGIVSYSDLLLQDWESLTPEAMREYQEIIGSKALALVEFVNELADLLSLEADRGTIHFYPAAVDAIVNDAYLAQAPAAKRRGVRVEAELDEKLPEVHIDLGKLSRAVRYLLSNAVRFAESGGRILLSARKEQHEGRGERVVISIWDDSMGAHPGDMAKILSPDQAASRQDMHRVEALGLGYYLVREIVELHGGEVWTVRSEGHSGLHLALPTERWFLSTHDGESDLPVQDEETPEARAA